MSEKDSRIIITAPFYHLDIIISEYSGGLEPYFEMKLPQREPITESQHLEIQKALKPVLDEAILNKQHKEVIK